MTFRTDPTVRLTVLVDDTEERVRAFPPRLEELGVEGPITPEPVETVRFDDAGEGPR
ncbi:hypothetical protein ACFQ67_27675 [Streptomyces sp. NPDC056488]|uniref:hypothetical protein n=1 Tax=Streptomyces sp. NPDC056488 TaxID=3345836 RepID=UPI0036A14033